MRVKRALALDGSPHERVEHIREGNAGGWRVATFRDGHVESLSASELLISHGVDPFTNVNHREA